MIGLVNFIIDLGFAIYFINRACSLNSVYHLVLGLGFLGMGYYWGKIVICVVN